MARKVQRGQKKLGLSKKKRHLPSRIKTTERSLPSSIVALLSRQTEAISEDEIAQSLHIPQPQLPLLHGILAQLLEEGAISKKAQHFLLAPKPTSLRGTLDLTAKGFGFAILEGEQAKGGKDIFIAAHNLGSATQGDSILVELIASSRRRQEGRVVEILNRAFTYLCGIFTAKGAGGFLTPDGDRLPYTVLIRPGDDLAAQDGMAVVVEITDYGSERQGPSGRIIELLGDLRAVSTQIRMAIVQSSIRESFSAEVEAEAAKLQAVTECGEDRIDLRHLPHVTIDGETAKDFDDAICVEQTDEGTTLYVSIADVSHYVQPGSAIDREAYLRGTSVYLPDRVLPMLPERLSNDLCSLVPDQDRPAFTAILSFDAKGRRTGAHYARSLIRSRRRFTYTTINQVLYLREPEVRAAHNDLVPMLEQAKELAALLKKQRDERGTLPFNIPEPQVRVDGDQVASITLAERNQAHLLIEECMLAANEAVAETLAMAHKPVLYRIHERPDPVKLETFTDAAKALGLHLPTFEIKPAWFAQVIKQACNSPTEYIVNTLLLRTMQQARYSVENAGHFGLATPFYLHFTSPIRRYPDLVVHRVLQALLTGQTASILDPVPDETTTLAEAGLHLSQCERKAIDVERNVHTRCSALLLTDHIGDTFGAIISGVTAFGLYLTLDESAISGMVPLTTMTDDSYLHDSRRYRLIGERSNKMYQLGNRVQVRLDHVGPLNKRLSFSLVLATLAQPQKKNGD